MIPPGDAAARDVPDPAARDEHVGFAVAAKVAETQQRETLWKGAEIKSLAPYIGNSIPLGGQRLETDVRESREKKNQQVAAELDKVVITQGLRPSLPYATLDRPKLSTSLYGTLAADIKTYKQGDLVIFQVETSITRRLRPDFKKSMILDVTLIRANSQVYVVNEKNALTAIKETTRDEAQRAFRYIRSTPALSDQQVGLPPDPELPPVPSHIMPAQTEE